MNKQQLPSSCCSITNEAWTYELFIRGLISTGISVRTSNRNNNQINSYIVTSPTFERIFNEVTSNEKFRGVGKAHRKRAIGSIILSAMTCIPEQSGKHVLGFLYRTSEAGSPIARYESRSFSVKAREPAIRHLKEHGYIEHCKGGSFARPDGEMAYLKTLLIPTSKLIDACRDIQNEPFEVCIDKSEELVRLYAAKVSSKGKAPLMNYEDNELTINSRNILKARNAINKQHCWAYHNEDNCQIIIPTDDLMMLRQFKEGSFEVYGRVHSNAQQINSHYRKSLTISGATTAELDFSAMQPTIAYAELQVTPPADLYAIKGFSRWQTKTALLIALNCRSKAQAAATLLKDKKIQDEKQPWQKCKRKVVTDIAQAHELLRQLEELHQPIKRYFYSQAWKSLTFIESSIMMSIIERLNALKIPAITIHDSVIVKDSDKFVTYIVMRKEFIRITGAASKITTS